MPRGVRPGRTWAGRTRAGCARDASATTTPWTRSPVQRPSRRLPVRVHLPHAWVDIRAAASKGGRQAATRTNRPPGPTRTAKNPGCRRVRLARRPSTIRVIGEVYVCERASGRNDLLALLLDLRLLAAEVAQV